LTINQLCNIILNTKLNYKEFMSFAINQTNPNTPRLETLTDSLVGNVCEYLNATDTLSVTLTCKSLSKCVQHDRVAI
jgi:hypothetical protein